MDDAAVWGFPIGGLWAVIAGLSADYVPLIIAGFCVMPIGAVLVGVVED